MKKVWKRTLAMLLVVILVGVATPFNIFENVFLNNNVYAANQTENENMICKKFCKFENNFFSIEGQYVYRYDLDYTNKTMLYKGYEYQAFLYVYKGVLYYTGEQGCLLKYNNLTCGFDKIYESNTNPVYAGVLSLGFYNNTIVIGEYEKIVLFDILSCRDYYSFDSDGMINTIGAKVYYLDKNYDTGLFSLKTFDIDLSRSNTMWSKKYNSSYSYGDDGTNIYNISISDIEVVGAMTYFILGSTQGSGHFFYGNLYCIDASGNISVIHESGSSLYNVNGSIYCSLGFNGYDGEWGIARINQKAYYIITEDLFSISDNYKQYFIHSNNEGLFVFDVETKKDIKVVDSTYYLSLYQSTINSFIREWNDDGYNITKDLVAVDYLANIYNDTVHFSPVICLPKGAWDNIYHEIYSCPYVIITGFMDNYRLDIYSNLPELTVGTDQYINFAACLYKNNEVVRSNQGYSLAIDNPAVLKLRSAKESGDDYIISFETLNSGTATVTVVENDSHIQKELIINVEEKCQYYRCDTLLSDDTLSSGGLFLNTFQCASGSSKTHSVSFNLYNTNYSYGSIEVYDGNGNFIKAVPLTPKSDGSGLGKVKNGFKYVYEDIFNRQDKWYEKEQNSSYNNIYLPSLENNCVLKISSDYRRCKTVALYNGLDLFFDVVIFASGIDVSVDAEKATLQKLLNAILENLPESGIESLVKEITKEMTESSLGNSVHNIYDLFYNLFSANSIDYIGIIKETLKGIGYSIGDTVVTTYVPLWKVVTLTDSAEEIAWQMIDSTNYDYIDEEIKISLNNHGFSNWLVDNAITVSSRNGFVGNTVLDAYKVQEEEKISNLPSGFLSSLIYNITLRKDGKETQPQENIEVRIPIPANLNPSKCAVYRLAEDGTKTK